MMLMMMMMTTATTTTTMMDDNDNDNGNGNGNDNDNDNNNGNDNDNDNNSPLSVTSDYDCILAMLLGSSRNGRLEVTRFSTYHFWNCQCNPEGCIVQHAQLTAPGSLNTCPMCKGQR